jgi:hypothetical protein
MTVKIPENVQQFMQGKLGWVATASADGLPNVAIKGSVRVLDDEHVMFADLFSGKTRNNLEANPKVAVMVYDLASSQGYVLKGTVELVASGPLYDRMVEILKQAPRPLPPPKYVVKIAVEEVYNQSMGPNAGKRLA